MKYNYDAYSRIGTRRNNHDSFVVCEGRNGLAAAVADGLGGYKGGELASKLFVEELEKGFESESFDLRQTFISANENILRAQEDLDNKMKTTAAAVWLSEDKAVFANVGDSRLYGFKDGEIVFQSTDHSVAQMCVDYGEITADQIRDHEDRCILTRSLGGREDVEVDVSIIDISEIDSILICSDGFWEYVVEQEMCDALKSSETVRQWLEKMCACREENVGQDNDNNTAVVIKFWEE